MTARNLIFPRFISIIFFRKSNRTAIEQEKIRQELEKANREQKLNSFLADFHTDEVSLAEITAEVEAVRGDIYSQQKNQNAESEAATQELLAIPGLLERVKQSELTPKSNCVNWRNLRSDEDYNNSRDCRGRFMQLIQTCNQPSSEPAQPHQ